jgi:hypothetical protein
MLPIAPTSLSRGFGRERLRSYNKQTFMTRLGTKAEIPFVEFSGTGSLY